ncbi:MAG: 2-hydroxyacyl-CoA dehydratase [Rhodocyclaceae bacterium]|nr:2-hydroxyacyl-CoA dehydratase [Rhodocyclaceae bacterium]
MIATIADRYCERPACPTKDYPAHTRFDHVLKLAQDYNAKAAVFLQQKFCDPHEGDYPDLKRHLEANGIPTLFLEFDITNPARAVPHPHRGLPRDAGRRRTVLTGPRQEERQHGKLPDRAAQVLEESQGAA